MIVPIKCDVFNICDLYEILNVLNKRLQIRNFTIEDSITNFLGKVKLYALNIASREIAQFLSLAATKRRFDG